MARAGLDKYPVLPIPLPLQEDSMTRKKKCHSAEQINKKLREADRMLAARKAIWQGARGKIALAFHRSPGSTRILAQGNHARGDKRPRPAQVRSAGTLAANRGNDLGKEAKPVRYLAVRGWGDHGRTVARAFNRVYRKRLDHVRGVLSELGFAGQELEPRSGPPRS